MEKYISLLIEQFKQATGIKNVDINSQSFMLGFSEWIKSRHSISNNYLDLLELEVIISIVFSYIYLVSSSSILPSFFSILSQL